MIILELKEKKILLAYLAELEKYFFEGQLINL